MSKKLALLITALAMTGLWACDDNDIMSNCANNDKRCNANAVEICTNGAWSVEKQCEASTLCNATSLTCEANTCSPNDSKRCNGKAIEICTNGAWKVQATCLGTSVCNANTLKCETTIITCEQGATRCTSNGKLDTCADNSWSASDCDAGQTCPAGKTACEIGTCSEGDIVCNDTKNGLLTCQDSAWLQTACTTDTPICLDNQCVACIDGEKRCRDNAVELCADNAWTTEKACKSQSCDPATRTCVSVNCSEGWERCNGNNVEVCNAANAYEASITCASTCLEYTSEHTAQCVSCTNDTHCASITGHTVCGKRYTCVPCHAGIDQKCDDTNGRLILCDTNGDWTRGRACNDGQRCEAGNNECTPISGYCSRNAECTNPHYPECYKHNCVCTHGQKACRIIDGKAVAFECSFEKWVESAKCDANKPVCDAANTKCVECSDNIHCADDAKCDTASNTCKSTLPASTITKCIGIFHDVPKQRFSGYVYDSRSKKDPNTITAKLLCGKAGQKISQYEETMGRYVQDYEGTSVYRAKPSIISGETYFCLWSYQLPGEQAIACGTNDTIIKDFSIIPSQTQAYSFTPNWDHIVDFENFKPVPRYNNEETAVEGMITATVLGMMAKEGSNGSLDGNTLVFSDNNDHHVTVSNAEKDAYIARLVFNTSSWTTDKFTTQKLDIFINDSKTPFRTIELSGNYDERYAVDLKLNQAVKSFRIQRLKNGTVTTPRLRIDNIRWTNH